MNTNPFHELKRLGEDLIRSVPAGRSEVAVGRAIAAATAPRPRRIPTLAAATLGLFVVANFGVASVADAAVPGDVLYPVDRAYEWVSDTVGLGGNRVDERLGEATALVERSDYHSAIELVSESVDDATLWAVGADLKAADLNAEDLSSRVSALVAGARQISTAARSGDSQALAAARAQVRQLAADVADAAGNDGTPGNSGDTPAVTAPGQTDDPGNSGDTPAVTAPGQTDDPSNSGNSGSSGDSPAVTAPSQSENPGQGKPGQGNPGQGNPGN